MNENLIKFGKGSFFKFPESITVKNVDYWNSFVELRINSIKVVKSADEENEELCSSNPSDKNNKLLRH